ncbi:hypothetical protein [Chamaesiphon sp. OTE_75_metabat_556]|uniref:hypothetical protein n=1 Tax=Chamaesiphon sp. OTE_75_metabat_556 TaxID=2964692 RepID=UPI00286C36D9|nr:hypothetical protein [Chamaesiphon sp. OTE_75_metabat_556]
MDLEAVRKMLQEVIQQQPVTLTWGTYLVFALIAMLSAYLGAYLKKKGETYATREDFYMVLDQVKKTNRATEEIKTAIARRSDFEMQVLLDRYKLVVDCETKIQTIATNVNRLRSGVQVPPDFIKDEDIVPLTQVFEQLSINHWLLGDSFHDLLLFQSKLLLTIANEKDSAKLATHTEKYQQSLIAFSKAMDDTFKISTITWSGEA